MDLVDWLIEPIMVNYGQLSSRVAPTRELFLNTQQVTGSNHKRTFPQYPATLLEGRLIICNKYYLSGLNLQLTRTCDFFCFCVSIEFRMIIKLLIIRRQRCHTATVSALRQNS